MTAGGGEPAVDEHDHPLGEPLDLVQHVRADDHGATAGPELAEQGDQLDALDRVGAVQRLVEHEHRRVGHQRGGDLRALAHPLAEAVDAASGDIEQPDRCQRRVRLALNLLASGLTFYFFRVSFQEAGDQNLPNVATLSPVEIPGLSSIPFFGDVLFSQPPLTYVALSMVPVIALYLHRTRRGLEIRIVGENPRAGDMRGLHVSALRYAAVVFGGMMAGLGGAFLTLDSAGLFVPQISGGRGFIAFALVIVGNWSAGRILLGALFFGLIDSLQLQLQATGADVPHQLLLALPYLMTIVVLVVSRARSNSPLALGRPYTRELS